MSVLLVVLKILKVIGIILLVILGIVLVLLLELLFVPIRYKAKGCFHDKKPVLKAKAHWLFSILHISYEYGRTKPLIIRIFGIPLKKKKDKTADINFEDDESEDDLEGISKESEKAVEKPDNNTKTEKAISDSEDKKIEKDDSDSVDETSSDSHPLKQEKDSSEKKSGIAESDISKNKEKTDKTNHKNTTQSKSLYDKINRYIEIIQSKRFKKAFILCKDKLIRLLKHILPRRWDIKADLSFADPSLTGKVLGISGALYPWFHKHIHVYSDFGPEHIDVDGYAKGRITLFTVLVLIGRVYFDKNIKRVIKLFREV